MPGRRFYVPARPKTLLAFLGGLPLSREALMQRCLDSTALAQRILTGLDNAMCDRPKTLRFWSAAIEGVTAPALVVSVEFVAGFPSLWVTFFNFYSEPVARFLQALAHCGATAAIGVKRSGSLEPKGARVAAPPPQSAKTLVQDIFAGPEFFSSTGGAATTLCGAFWRMHIDFAQLRQ